MLPLLAPWVIDSGTFAHMTCTLGHLTNLSPIGHLSRVTFADGSTSGIHGLGIASLGPSLSLQSVLYVPKFFLILCMLVVLLNHLTVQ